MSTILIVEDEPGMVSFMTKGLRAQGHSTLAVSDGEAGLEKALSGRFDLVLLDLGPPTMDSTEVLEQLRARGCTTPVVVLAALGSESGRDGAVPPGAEAYLAKPFRFVELLAAVRAQLGLT